MFIFIGASDHMPILAHFSIRNKLTPKKNSDNDNNDSSDSESSSSGDAEGMKRERLLQALKGMGFMDEKRNLRALEEAPNLEEVVYILLNEKAQKL